MLKTRWPLVLILLSFVILKYPHLFYAYYWDESWPYASAVYRMYLHGPSLMPGAISGELSRGHPLMFHFLAATWLNIFGISRLAMHSFPLFIAILFLIVIYEAGFRMFNIGTTVTAVLLIAFQQIFFVQSSFVLIELMLALLAFAGLYFYVTQKYVLGALALTMLFYTKESGLVLGIVLGLDALIRLFKKQYGVKEKISTLLSVAVPFILAGCFFIMQKAVSGWYVLPLYTQTVQLEWGAFAQKMRMIAYLIFSEDNRWIYFWLLLLCAVFVAVKKRSAKYFIPLLPGLFVFLLSRDRSNGFFMKYWLPPAYCLAIISTIIVMVKITGFNNSIQRRFMVLAALFIVSFFVFTGLNIFIERYLLIALVPLLFISAVYYNYYVNKISRYAVVPSLLLILFIEGYTFAYSQGLGDTKIGAFDAMHVQEQITSYLETKGYQGTSISTGAFLESIHLTDPYSGFLRAKDTFVNVNWDITYHTKLVIFDNIETDKRYWEVKNDTPRFTLVFRAAHGEAWGEIYRKNFK